MLDEKVSAANTAMLIGSGLKTVPRDALDKIHAATLEVLQFTGIRVDCEEALDILAKGGCWVNKKTQVARLPEHVLVQTLSNCE